MGMLREPLAEGTEGAPQLGPERPRVYSDLSPEEKDQYNADIRAINILHQGLPKDIYTLINNYTDAKDIWDNVKMLLEGSELTKEDQESQLYDDFEHFRQHKGESIHDYYLWFTKVIHDMRNIKMTMSRMQLNSKFVNNMLPEWGRFVIAVKLNRGLRDSNYDQLYAYLKQHETHAKENKMMLERFSQNTMDPLALMSNVLNPHCYSPLSSTSSSTQVPQHLADNPHLDSSQGMNPRGGGAAGYGGAQNRVGNVNPGQARPVKRYNCNSAGHIAQKNGVALDAEQLLFLAGGQDNAFDDDVDEQPVQDLALNVDNVFQADDFDAFDFDVDEASTAQTMFMANLSSADPVTDEARPSYDSDVLSEVQNHDHYQDAVCAHHEEHVMHDSYVKDNEVPVVHSNVSFVPNNAFMMIYNDMCEPHAQAKRDATAEKTALLMKIGVIEFRDSYVVPKNGAATDSASDGTATKKGRTVAVTSEDMQKRRNDVKARTTLLLALPDEHQLPTKKTKKNLLKQQYGNFKAEGSETLEQTFNRLQVIVSQLEFMDIEIEQDDLNQKFLTSLAPEWLMHTIVWRNRSDLDMMSLDDLYNHIKVYESEVQKKPKSNS
nr:hypothetical protein [Tanacetum cinerariifolium]